MKCSRAIGFACTHTGDEACLSRSVCSNALGTIAAVARVGYEVALDLGRQAYNVKDFQTQARM